MKAAARAPCGLARHGEAHEVVTAPQGAAQPEGRAPFAPATGIDLLHPGSGTHAAERVAAAQMHTATHTSPSHHVEATLAPVAAPVAHLPAVQLSGSPGGCVESNRFMTLSSQPQDDASQPHLEFAAEPSLSALPGAPDATFVDQEQVCCEGTGAPVLLPDAAMKFDRAAHAADGEAAADADVLQQPATSKAQKPSSTPSSATDARPCDGVTLGNPVSRKYAAHAPVLPGSSQATDALPHAAQGTCHVPHDTASPGRRTAHQEVHAAVGAVIAAPAHKDDVQLPPDRAADAGPASPMCMPPPSAAVMADNAADAPADQDAVGMQDRTEAPSVVDLSNDMTQQQCLPAASHALPEQARDSTEASKAFSTGFDIPPSKRTMLPKQGWQKRKRSGSAGARAGGHTAPVTTGPRLTLTPSKPRDAAAAAIDSEHAADEVGQRLGAGDERKAADAEGAARIEAQGVAGGAAACDAPVPQQPAIMLQVDENADYSGPVRPADVGQAHACMSDHARPSSAENASGQPVAPDATEPQEQSLQSCHGHAEAGASNAAQPMAAQAAATQREQCSPGSKRQPFLPPGAHGTSGGQVTETPLESCSWRPAGTQMMHTPQRLGFASNTCIPDTPSASEHEDDPSSQQRSQRLLAMQPPLVARRQRAQQALTAHARAPEPTQDGNGANPRQTTAAQAAYAGEYAVCCTAANGTRGNDVAAKSATPNASCQRGKENADSTQRAETAPDGNVKAGNPNVPAHMHVSGIATTDCTAAEHVNPQAHTVRVAGGASVAAAHSPAPHLDQGHAMVIPKVLPVPTKRPSRLSRLPGRAARNSAQ